MLMIYIHPRCGTVKKALKWFQEHEVEYTTLDLTQKSIPQELLATMVKQSRLPVKKFFNTSGQVYKALELSSKIKTMSEEECLNLLASNGLLVKRPVVTDGEKVTVGFSEEMFEQTWGK